MPSVSTDWHPTSWQALPARQQPAYPDPAAVEQVLADLAALPPLVTSWEIERLKTMLAEAAAGRRFVLQGGDCAEQFEECRPGIIADRLKIILQMSLALVYGLRLPVVRIGRFAGQYAKPRSAPTETRGGLTLPSYRGDIINRPGFSEAERTPDPNRLRDAYTYSALTLNHVRALAEGGFADLNHPENWNLDFAQHALLADEYHRMVQAIRDAIDFMEVVTDAPLGNLERVEFFTSHEALHLLYEQALTHYVEHQGRTYNLSTHFPWVGKRTAQIEEAHVEYVRGLANPIGVKVGPDLSPAALCDLIRLLDPDEEPGRLTLIHRFGVDAIESCLPPLIDAVQRSGRTVLWMCDPMHGNTLKTELGIKTRRFEHIVGELEVAFDVHSAMGSWLGGVHFELTGENVTECLGGARGLEEADLERAYKSVVDPRLNNEQALEMALRIVRKRRG